MGRWLPQQRRELWRRLRSEGLGGSLRVVGEWVTRRRRAEKASGQQLRKIPSNGFVTLPN